MHQQANNGHKIKPEVQLIASAKDGDMNALEHLLLMHHSELLAYFGSRISGELRAAFDEEDLRQEVYHHVFKRFQTLRASSPEAFRAWLFKIARHCLADKCRRFNSQKRGGDFRKIEVGERSQSMVILLEDLMSDSETPSRSVRRAEALEALEQALDALKPDYREVVEMQYFQGMCVADIARQTNRTEPAVHNLCLRARKKLRERIGSESDYFTNL